LFLPRLFWQTGDQDVWALVQDAQAGESTSIG
jgi:hypothetical protein